MNPGDAQQESGTRESKTERDLFRIMTLSTALGFGGAGGISLFTQRSRQRCEFCLFDGNRGCVRVGCNRWLGFLARSPLRHAKKSLKQGPIYCVTLNLLQFPRLSIMNQLVAFRISACLGFFAVAVGAFGAHGLSAILKRHGTAEIWEKAVLYHFVHAVVMLILARTRPWQRGPWFCFLAGILVFSGSLYALAGTNMRWLGAMTPFGGIEFSSGLALAGPHGRTARIRISL